MTVRFVGSKPPWPMKKIISLLRVATQSSSLQIHQRKAVSEVSLPGSGHSSPSADDPKRSISFLHSRRSAKPNFCAMEIYEAVVGGLIPGNFDLAVEGFGCSHIVPT